MTPDDVSYTEQHEWVRQNEGGTVVFGITDFAQDALGDVVFVALPEVGGEVAAAASIAEVESTKSVSEIYAPIAGTVVEANADLEATPELVNRDPYGAGWIFAVEVADPASLDGLMDAAAYRALVEG